MRVLTMQYICSAVNSMATYLRGLTLTAGVHRTYIGRLERGESGVTVEALAAIPAALDIAILPFSEPLKDGLIHCPKKSGALYLRALADAMNGYSVRSMRPVLPHCGYWEALNARSWSNLAVSQAICEWGIQMKPAALVATLLLSVVAMLHLLRLLLQLQFTVGGTEIPMWASVPAVLGPGALAVWLWREQRK